MKSQRLTNDLKDQIWKQIYNEKFYAGIEQIKNDKKAFADKCYNKVFNKSERQMMIVAPKGAFGFDDSLKMFFGGCNVYLQLSRKVPFFSNYSERNKLGNDHPLTIEFLALTDLEEKEQEYRRIARKYVFSILNSCTTTNKLLEVWPECKKYVEQAIGQPIVSNLPAIITTELNKILGL